MVNPAGNKTIPAAMNCERVFVKSVSGREKYFANARATKILHNSAGWKLKDPNSMIDSVPLIRE